MQGVYVVSAADGSTFTCFSSEIEALKHNVANPEMKIGFVAFGESFGAKNLPTPKVKKAK